MQKIYRSLFPAILAGILAISMSVSAFAELVPTGKEWNVSFTEDKKMSSDFKTSAMDDSVSNLQPGDYTDIVLNLKNYNSETVDWYMTNKVLKTLEETRTAQEGLSGGAYTYILTYKNPKTKQSKELFNSDTVGGESVSAAGEGLHEATSALGQDWLYLDTFAEGDGGVITLRVALDGETQGNTYQDTFAELQMNFAVELNTNENNKKKKEEKKNNNGSNGSRSNSSSSNSTNNIVRTGDETNWIPYIITAGVSGIILLVLAIYSLRERRKQRGGAS